MEFSFVHNQTNLRKILMEFYSLSYSQAKDFPDYVGGFFVYALMIKQENICVQATSESSSKMLLPGEEYSNLVAGAPEELKRQGWIKVDKDYTKRFSGEEIISRHDVSRISDRAAKEIMKAFSCYRNYRIDCMAEAQIEDFYDEKRIKLKQRDFVSIERVSDRATKRKLDEPAPKRLWDWTEEKETIETKLKAIEDLYERSLITKEERIAMRKKTLDLD